MTTITRNVLKIDGSYLEGGGQVLRNSFAYSALLQRPIDIDQIRARRTPPGLRPQHAKGLELVSKISANSSLTGATPKSSEVQFEPGTITPGTYTADPGTAGSTTLLLQVSLPCLLFPSWNATSQLNLFGGTNASMAPPIDFVEHVLFPFLSRFFGIHPTLEIRRRGYFPRGGGEILVTVQPMASTIPAITLTNRGPVTRIRGKAYVAGVLPLRMSQIAAKAARDRLRGAGYNSFIVDIEEVQEPRDRAEGNGSGIFLWAETQGGCILAGSSIGDKSKRPEVVGDEAADMLVTNLAHGGCVDEHLQDQIIIFMALAQGTSSVVCGPLSLHTETAIWIAETMIKARFSVTEAGGRFTIRCDGIGLRAEDGQEAVLAEKPPLGM